MPNAPFPYVPEFWTADRLDELLRKVVQGLNGALDGQTNNVYPITLRPGEATTFFTMDRITAATVPVMQPMSASAAEAMRNGMYTTVSLGEVTFHHDSLADTDRDFGLVLNG